MSLLRALWQFTLAIGLVVALCGTVTWMVVTAFIADVLEAK